MKANMIRKGDLVRLKKNGYEGRVTFIAYVGDIWWYDIDDKYINIAEYEVEKVKLIITDESNTFQKPLDDGNY